MSTTRPPRTEAYDREHSEEPGVGGATRSWWRCVPMEQLTSVEERLRWAVPAAPDAGLREALSKVQAFQPVALDYIRRNGFVINVVGPLTDESIELDRWKVLAFSLYSDLCEVNAEAEHALAAHRSSDPPPAPASDPIVDCPRCGDEWSVAAPAGPDVPA